MAKALVLGALKTGFIGLQTLVTGNDRVDTVDMTNRVLLAAWLAHAETARGALYGALAVRVGTLTASTEGIALKNGWFGGSMNTTSLLHGEGLAWYGELPLFDKRAITLVLYARNDSGTNLSYTGGYAWKEFETNDRPS